MKPSRLLLLAMTAGCATAFVRADEAGSCADLANLKIEGVEFTTAAPVAAGTTTRLFADVFERAPSSRGDLAPTSWPSLRYPPPSQPRGSDRSVALCLEFRRRGAR